MLDLYEEFKNLIESLHRREIPYALCGGLAMAVYGMPRATVDIDLLAPPESVPELMDMAAGLGFDVPAGVMRFAEGAVIIHRRSKTDPESGDLVSLDLIEVTPAFEEVWAKREKASWEKGEICVVGREGLIQMKSLRMSGQDGDDILFLRGRTDEG
jgi:hypothetical protein